MKYKYREDLKRGDWYFLRGCKGVPVSSLRYDGVDENGFDLFVARDGIIFAVERGAAEVYERDDVESGRVFFGRAVVKESQPIGGDFQRKRKGRRGIHGKSVYRSYHELPLFGKNEGK